MVPRLFFVIIEIMWAPLELRLCAALYPSSAR